MVIELQVYSMLGGRQCDFQDMVRRFDLVDFSDVLADKRVEEPLSDLIPCSVPRCRSSLSERMKGFRGRLSLAATLDVFA